VPPRYVPLFLGALLMPQQAWERIQGQLVMDGQEEACHALIKYLQASLTIPAEGADPALALGEPLVPPLADHLLLDYCQCIIKADFPELNAQLAGLEQNQIVANLGELVQDN